MSTKKAFVRYANNKAVPGSLIIRTQAPKVGVWKEIPYNLCCENNNTMNYKVYTAILNQTGTNAPIATVLENTLGVDIDWTYDGDGFSIGTATSPVFTAGKTFLLINSNTDYNYSTVGQGYFSLFYGSTSVVYINTWFITDTNVKNYASNMLYETSVEIRVYP